MMSDSPCADSLVNIHKLMALAKYDDNVAVQIPVDEGQNYKSFVINILPGQEVQKLNHVGHEVLLVPQTGTATLFSSSAKPVRLVCGSVYSDHCGTNYGLRNTGVYPFQVLVILIKVLDNG